MTIPDYQTLMLPVLRIAAAGPTRVPVAAEQIADELGLLPSERDAMLPSGRQRLLHNRVHWAKFYLSKAGLIESLKRGVFTASQAGRDLLATRPVRIDVERLKRYPAFVEFFERSSGEGGGSSEEPEADGPADLHITPEEQIDAASAILSKALKAELLARVLDQSPAFFERLIVDLLVAMGYGGSHDAAARQLGRSGDGGVDGVIDEDRLGLDRIFVQAKRYANGLVGRPQVQEFVGSLVGHGATKGVLVTTSAFSRQAIDYARGLQQRVILIDGDRLSELMIEHGVGVRVSRTVEVKRLDEDFFSDDA